MPSGKSRRQYQIIVLPDDCRLVSACRGVSAICGCDDTFDHQRHLVSRPTLRLGRADAMAQWRGATLAA
jgi:hypothetical protein